MRWGPPAVGEPQELRTTHAVLVGLPGTPLPDALARDKIALAEKGTGRQRLTEVERDPLGPLAERFPRSPDCT